jgi:NADH-quinone oxidoreductase subunit F
MELAGGVWKGRALKGVMPAGASSPVIPAELAWTLQLDWESVAAAGSTLGSASFIVLDETVDMVWVADKTTRFFKHESCGKCSPCREGTYWMAKLYARLRSGRGSPEDVQLLDDLVRDIDGKCFCPLGEFALSAPRSTLKLFRDDYERALSRETVSEGIEST